MSISLINRINIFLEEKCKKKRVYEVIYKNEFAYILAIEYLKFSIKEKIYKVIFETEKRYLKADDISYINHQKEKETIKIIINNLDYFLQALTIEEFKELEKLLKNKGNMIIFKSYDDFTKAELLASYPIRKAVQTTLERLYQKNKSIIIMLKEKSLKEINSEENLL